MMTKTTIELVTVKGQMSLTVNDDIIHTSSKDVWERSGNQSCINSINALFAEALEKHFLKSFDEGSA